MQKTINENRVPSISSLEILLSDPFDEQNWLTIFGEDDLKSKVCTVIIRETFHFFGNSRYSTKNYRKEYLAFTRPW